MGVSKRVMAGIAALVLMAELLSVRTSDGRYADQVVWEALSHD